MLRLFDCTTYLDYQPEGSRRSLHRVPGAAHLSRKAIFPAPDFLDSAGRILRPEHRASLHDARVAQLETAFGRHGIGNDSRVVLYSIGDFDVGDAVLVDAAIARLRRPACSTAGSTNGRRKAAPSRPGRRRVIRPRHSPQNRRAGYFVDKREVLEGPHQSLHRRRQRARSAILQGPGAEPLRPRRPHPRQRQCAGSDACRCRKQGVRFASDDARKNSPRRGSQRTSA